MRVIITENQLNKLIETVDKPKTYVGAWEDSTQKKSDVIRLIKLAVDRLRNKMDVEQLYNVLVLLLNKEREHTQNKNIG